MSLRHTDRRWRGMNLAQLSVRKSVKDGLRVVERFGMLRHRATAPKTHHPRVREQRVQTVDIVFAQSAQSYAVAFQYRELR